MNGELAHMVERSLSMREVPGSMPGFSIVFFFFFNTDRTLDTMRVVPGSMPGSSIIFLFFLHFQENRSTSAALLEKEQDILSRNVNNCFVIIAYSMFSMFSSYTVPGD